MKIGDSPALNQQQISRLLYLRPMEPHYLEPDLYFWDVRVTEFSIALTSVFVALVCLYAWQRLGRHSRTPELRLFRAFLILMGVSTFIGGLVGHAFLYYVPFVFKTPGWVLGMLAVTALGQTCIERSRVFLNRTWVRSLTVLNVVELLLATVFVFITLWFPLVEIHSAFGMLLLVGALEGWNYYKTRQQNDLLAIPETAYDSFFQKEFPQLIIQEYQLELLVYSIENEVIQQWLP